jgi:glyoxylase-like metal-dependent hydrolase (beta-lactamase superfamily II)
LDEEDGMEILPSVHRIESDLGERFMCQYLLTGEDRTILVDTGLAGTPEEVILPYLENIGLTIEDVDEVIISHADVDHCGGNRVLKEMRPRLRFSCGEPDRYLIEDNRVMLSELYSWSEPYGFGPHEETKIWILKELGGNVPIDTGLRGGETLRLGSGQRFEVLHLPGHTAGHLGLWQPETGAAIIIDAVLESGIYDRAGNRLIPPRYFDAGWIEGTIRRLQALNPQHLLTAHYPPMRGQEVPDFLDRSLDYTRQVRRVVGEGLAAGVTDLWELTKYADEQLGPYPEMMAELGAPVRAYMAAF